jgi:hypothetical protein
MKQPLCSSSLQNRFFLKQRQLFFCPAARSIPASISTLSSVASPCMYKMFSRKLSIRSFSFLFELHAWLFGRLKYGDRRQT